MLKDILLDDYDEQIRFENRKDFDILCEKCGRVPSLTVYSLTPFRIEKRCKKCGTNSINSISELGDYILPKGERKRKGYCLIHSEEKNSVFCEDCGIQYCKKCNARAHENHQKISIAEMPSKGKFEKGIEQINEFVKINNKEKQKFIDDFKKKISDIESAFDRNNQINSSILEYIELLLYNYNSTDYFSIRNLEEIFGCFQKNDINKRGDNIDEVVEILKKNFVVNLSLIGKKNITNFKPFKSLKEVKKPTIITDPSSNINCLCIIKEGELAAGDYEGDIKLYDINKNVCYLHLEKAHKDKVNSLCITQDKYSGTDDYLISGSDDKNIKIWEFFNSGLKCIKEIEDNEGSISKVIPLSGERFASCACSSDSDIKIWEWRNKEYKLLKTFKEYSDSISCLKEIKNIHALAFLGFHRLTLLELNGNDYSCKHQTSKSSKDSKDRVSHCLIFEEIKNNRIIAGGGKRLIIYNYITYKVEKEIRNDSFGWIYSMCGLKNGNALIGNEKGVIYEYDSNKNDLSCEKNIYDKKISYLISGSDNKVFFSSDVIGVLD